MEITDSDVLEAMQETALEPRFKEVSHWPKPEKNQTLSECKFMADGLTSLGSLDAQAQQFFASIYSKLDDEKISEQEFFEIYTKTAENFSIDDMKYNYTYGARLMNPVTCSNISANYPDKCKDCPHFVSNTSDQSPINIRGESHMATKETGFWRVKDSKKDGKITYSKDISLEDLTKLYSLQHSFVTHKQSGAVYTWNGSHYQSVWTADLGDFLLKNVGRNPETEIMKRHVSEFEARLAINNLRDNDWWMGERLEYKINCLNGIVDIRTGELLPHNQTFPFRYVLPYEYDEHADCPNFRKFLQDVSLNRQGLVDIIQEYLGYCVAGGPIKIHKSLFLDGDGSNGKSTFIEMLKAIVGNANYSSLSLNDLSNPNNRYMMTEKLVNIGEETNRKALMQSAQFKTMAGGGETTAKKLYEDTFTFRNKTKFIIVCNGMPITDDRSGGLKRRLLIVPFDAQFSEKKGNIDYDIKDKMMSELAGILNFAIEGFMRLERNGYKFTKCEEVDAKLEEYELENNTVVHFAKERIEWVEKTDQFYKTLQPEKPMIYMKYKWFCEEEGKHPITANEFWKQLKKLNPEMKTQRLRANGKRIHVVKGLRYVD